MASPGRKRELSEIEALVGLNMLVDPDTNPVVSSSELAAWANVSTDTARARLNELCESGDAARKKIGARALVYWVTDQGRSRLGGED